MDNTPPIADATTGGMPPAGHAHARSLEVALAPLNSVVPTQLGRDDGAAESLTMGSVTGLVVGLGALAWMAARALAGMDPGGGGLAHLLDSLPDAPNSPSAGPTVAGGAGAGSGPPGPPDGRGDSGSGPPGPPNGNNDPGSGPSDPPNENNDPESGPPDPPDGFEDWMDFSDWVSWTSLKNALPGGLSIPIDVLEMGPETARTLDKVKKHNQRNREALETDYSGTAHLDKGDK